MNYKISIEDIQKEKDEWRNKFEEKKKEFLEGCNNINENKMSIDYEREFFSTYAEFKQYKESLNKNYIIEIAYIIDNPEIAYYYLDILLKFDNIEWLKNYFDKWEFISKFIIITSPSIARKIYEIIMENKINDGKCFGLLFHLIDKKINEMDRGIDIIENVYKKGITDFYTLSDSIKYSDNKSKMRAFIEGTANNVPSEILNIILNSGEYHEIDLCEKAFKEGMDVKNLKKLSELKGYMEKELFYKAYTEKINENTLNKLYEANDYDKMVQIMKDYILQLNKKFNIE